MIEPQTAKKVSDIAWDLPNSGGLLVECATENILIVHSILGNNIRYCLMFGTLLGAIRDQDFIRYDKDTDIGLLDVNEAVITGLKEELRRFEFYIFRDNPAFFSAMRKGEYIDFYKFYKVSKSYVCGNYIFDADFFNEIEYANFMGKGFPIPKHSENFLAVLYGDDWRVPLVGRHFKGIGDGDNSFKLSFKINNWYHLTRAKSPLFDIIMKWWISRIFIKLIKRLI